MKKQESYKVLCTGLNKLPIKGVDKLNCAESDARAVAAYFEASSLVSDVTCLTGNNTKKADILQWLEESNNSPAETTVVLYFAGHGSASIDEEEKKLERCLYVDGNRYASHEPHILPVSEIIKRVSHSPQRFIFIIDACYSFADDISSFKPFRDYKEAERFDSRKVYVMISATALNEDTFEDTGLGYGILTHQFLKTISGKYSAFWRKTIPVFRFLDVLDKKVKAYRYSNLTGRKRLHPDTVKNGIMVYCSDAKFNVPILEPVPYLEHILKPPGKSRYHRWISRLFHFFTRTRLRAKISLAVLFAAFSMMIFSIVSHSLVSFSYHPMQQSGFLHYPSNQRGLPLAGIRGTMFGRQRSNAAFEITLYKHSWIEALESKLDMSGKIVLRSNLLGRPRDYFDHKPLVVFALDNPSTVFYWDTGDVMQVVKEIRRRYRRLNNPDRVKALKLLANLGKTGANTAREIVNLEAEQNREIRNIFLAHYSTNQFLSKNKNILTLQDYLYLKQVKKNLPAPVEAFFEKSKNEYLSNIVKKFPTKKELTNSASRERLDTSFKQLKILAIFGHKDFRKLARLFLNRAFEPYYFFSLAGNCSRPSDKAWVLTYYLKNTRVLDSRFNFWQRMAYTHIGNLPPPQKGAVIKILFDLHFHSIPGNYRDSLLWMLPKTSAESVTLTDLKRWITKYRDSISPGYVLETLVKLPYPERFEFILQHYQFFLGHFYQEAFEDMHSSRPDKTVEFLHRLFALTGKRDRLRIAVFMFNNHHHHMYGNFIYNFIRDAGTDMEKQSVLIDFRGSLNNALMRMAKEKDTYPDISRSYQYFLKNRVLLLKSLPFNLYMWPARVKKILEDIPVPRDYSSGNKLFIYFSRLPEPLRKKMLLKIFKHDLDLNFQYSIEKRIAKRYPQDFLRHVYGDDYLWGRYTRDAIVISYQTFSWRELVQKLRANLRDGCYWKSHLIATALVTKVKKDGLLIKELESILGEFNRPLARIALKDIRYEINRHRFQEEKQ